MSIPRTHMVIMVAAGGAAGASVRFLLGAVSQTALLVTAGVNISGCFLLGVLVYSDRSIAPVPPSARALIGTGFLSSFTTYSTFIADIAATEPIVAALYLAGSYLGGFSAVIVARYLVEKWGEHQ